MNNQVFNFKTLHLAISILFEDKYLVYLNPATNNLSAFFCKKVISTPGRLSYDEILQMAKILLDSFFIMPNISSTIEDITLLQKINDQGGNTLLCFSFVPDVKIDEALTIKSRTGNHNYIAFMRLCDVNSWEHKDKYTEKLLPLLTY